MGGRRLFAPYYAVGARTVPRGTPPDPPACCRCPLGPALPPQGDLHALKAAAATLLLSADAGVGPAGGVLRLARDALEAIMGMS